MAVTWLVVGMAKARQADNPERTAHLRTGKVGSRGRFAVVFETYTMATYTEGKWKDTD